MGWSSGSRLMGDVIDALKDNVPEQDIRENIYAAIIPAFEDADWDTQDECMGEDDAFDAVMYDLHPDWFEDDDD